MEASTYLIREARKLAQPTLFTALLLAAGGSVPAWADTLANHVSPGKWDLAYKRTGEFKPLFFKRKEEGHSTTCIKGDPHQYILNWLARKGCHADKEEFLADRYHISGECRIKWLPGYKAAAEVDLYYGETKSSFVIDIRSVNDPLLGYDEHTIGTLVGPCDP